MEFDIEDGNEYFGIIKQLEISNHFADNDLGDPRGLDWDIDFLRTIVKTIERDHHNELAEAIPNYQPIRLAGSFIYNAMTYAVVNNKGQVSRQEQLNAFKEWNWMPFDIRLQVLDTLYQEQDLDSTTHPFGIRQKPKEKVVRKIIPFPNTNQNKSE